MRVIVTGGAGFIGANLVDYLVKNTDWDILVIDYPSYVNCNWYRLKEFGIYNTDRCKCIEWNLVFAFNEEIIEKLGDINIIINMAAETHVDKSIRDPVRILHNNITSVINMLEYARKLKNLKIFHYFSTDEVYGPAPPGVAYKEDARHDPKNPYSASKSCAEQICVSYNNTYRIPLLISNLMNVFGPYQDEEKFIPLVIQKLFKEEEVSICVDEETDAMGSRFYIHAAKVARIIHQIICYSLENPSKGAGKFERYNIVGDREVDNLTLALKISDICGKKLNYKLVKHHFARPSQDTRYALDGSKLETIGITKKDTFDEDLKNVVLSYINDEIRGSKLSLRESRNF